MATPVQIAGGSYRPRHAIANLYGGAIYVRLYHRTNDELSMWKSTDSGATWSQAGGTVSCGGGQTFTPGCGTLDPAAGIIYCSYFKYPTGRVDIARFDCSSDSWLTDTTGPSVPFSHWNQVGVRSDGSLVLIYLHDEVDPFGSLGSHRRKWCYWTAGGSGDLSSAWQTWFSTQIDPMLGPVIIAADDAAHFFYHRSLSGSSSTDLELMHRRLTSAGSLGSETTAVDFDGTVWYPRGGVSADISGTDSVIYSLTDGDSITDAPAMLHGAATGVPATYSVHPSAATDQQGITKVNATVYGTWPVSQSSGEYTGVKIGKFTAGAWESSDTVVNAGASGEPTWTWWTVNALGTGALGFVLDNWDTEHPWFLRHPLSAAVNRWYAL